MSHRFAGFRPYTLGGLLGALLVASQSGCGGPESPSDAGSDSGAVLVEDAGVVDDGGPLDGSAEPDAGPPMPCVGPPGLYREGSCSTLAEGVRVYQPRFSLWTDDAVKERFIYLPPGTQIDTSMPNDWVFPVGTRIYKTFSIDGVRLETRMLHKDRLGTGPTAWQMRTYAWNAAQDRARDVTNEPLSVRENVLGTDHDIPSGAQCRECHRASLDTSNSFTAIQLNHELDGLNLEQLMREEVLTNAIDPAAARIPGTAEEVAALGYLHANCGNCHRQTPPDAGCVDPACGTGLHLWVEVGLPDVAATAAYRTAVGVAGSYPHPSVVGACRVHPGHPELSTVIYRSSERGVSAQMPPLGTEFVHEAGLEILRTWIRGLTTDASECPPVP